MKVMSKYLEEYGVSSYLKRRKNKKLIDKLMNRGKQSEKEAIAKINAERKKLGL